MAANLRAQGVRRGDKVSIMLPNLPQTVIAFWAVLKAGGVVVMTNPLYMEKELVHQIHDSGARFMIALDLVWPKIEPLRDRLGIDKYFLTRIGDGLAFPLNLLYAFKAKREGTWRDLPFDGRHVLPWKTLLKGKARYSTTTCNPTDDLAVLQYTGGTTGISKGVMLTHHNMSVNVQQITTILGDACHMDHCFLGLMPYFHVYGLTTCLTLPTALSATVVPFPRYVPRDVLVGIQKHKPTIFPGAPSIYISLMQQKEVGDYDLTSIRYCISGSAPMPVEHIKRFRELTGAQVIEGFGLHRGAHRGHGSGPGAAARGQGGRTDHPWPAGHEGLLEPPGRNRQHPAQWLAVHRRHRHHGRGRLLQHRGPQEGHVPGGRLQRLPARDRRGAARAPQGQGSGDRGRAPPHARRDHQGLRGGEARRKAREKLASYKVPKQVEFRDDLPKTVVGKVLRRILRAEEEEKLKAELAASPADTAASDEDGAQ